MDTISSILPTQENTQPLPTGPLSKPVEKAPESKQESVETTRTNEIYSVSQIITTKDDDDQNKIPKGTVKQEISNIVDLTKELEVLQPVDKNAEPETKALEEEEQEFIKDVEAAHGHK